MLSSDRTTSAGRGARPTKQRCMPRLALSPCRSLTQRQRRMTSNACALHWQQPLGICGHSWSLLLTGHDAAALYRGSTGTTGHVLQRHSCLHRRNNNMSNVLPLLQILGMVFSMIRSLCSDQSPKVSATSVSVVRDVSAGWLSPYRAFLV